MPNKIPSDTQWSDLASKIKAKQDISDYSTTEINTGIKWTDGKTIYRKVVDSGVLTGSISIVYDALTGVDTLVNAVGYWVNTSNNQHTTFNGTFAIEISGKTCVQTTRALLNTSGTHAGKVSLQFTQVFGTLPAGVRMVVALDYTKL